MAIPRSERISVARPTWYITRIGARVWFYHSSLVRVPGTVRRSDKQTLEVEPERGALRRTIRLKWDDVYWEERDS